MNWVAQDFGGWDCKRATHLFRARPPLTVRPFTTWFRALACGTAGHETNALCLSGLIMPAFEARCDVGDHRYLYWAGAETGAIRHLQTKKAFPVFLRVWSSRM